LPIAKSRFGTLTPSSARKHLSRPFASCRTSKRLFPPRAKGLRNKGKQTTTHQTINGRVRVCRTVYWSAEAGATIPMDQWLGITEHRFSPGVREMCCRESLHCSFEVASDNLCRTAQMELSGRTIRTIVENQGRAVLSAQQTGALQPGFVASDCTDQTVISKRAKQGRRSTARAGRPKKGSDGDYKEFKIVSFYDPDKSHCHVVGTAGNHEALGRIMRREAGRLQFASVCLCEGQVRGHRWRRVDRQTIPGAVADVG